MSESIRKQYRSAEEQIALIHRLNRVEGQIRGIRNMIANDAYCVDILTQTNAAAGALNSFARTMLTEHVRTCVASEIREGNEAAIEELNDLIDKFMK